MPIHELYFPKSDIRIDPILCGNENCTPDHGWGPAVRIYWLIHYVVSGRGKFQINGKTHCVTLGSFFVIPPYEEVLYQADHDDPWSYIWIGFTCSGLLPVTLNPVMYCPDGYEVFRQIAECDQLAGGQKSYLTARLWDLFALLQQEKTPADSCIHQALSYIHSKYMNQISVEDIARRVNLERSYFTTAFTRQVGISPGKYLQNYRMEVAADLLKRGGKSVSITAQSVGYSDIYTFSKTFKRHFGMPPSQYAQK